jgi:hypothetical protein
MDRMRASDQEREAAVGVLRAAAHEGRLDTDELEERVARAYAAKTRGELTALVDDLPNAAPRASVGPPAPLPRAPGTAGFIARWQAPVPLERATSDLMEFVVPPLRAHGYQIVGRSRTELVFERSRQPVWTIVVAVAVFPIGLLALLHRRREQVILSAVEHGGETTIIAQGEAPLRVRRALSELEREPRRAGTTP